MTINNSITTKYKMLPLSNWRDASEQQWNSARWTSGIQATIDEAFIDKTIVCGHWHSFAWHDHFESNTNVKNFKEYITEKVIALDAMTVVSNVVNCIIIEQ